MAISGINGYDNLFIDYKKIPEYDADKTKYEGVTTTLKFLNKTSYNELILAQ